MNEGRSPIVTLGLHVSSGGDLLLCSTEVYQHPDRFKRLWVVHSGDLSVLSQVDPQQITSEQYEVAGFTNGDKTVRIASDPVTDIKSVTIWDLDASDLTRVVSKRVVVPDPPGFLGSKVSTGRLLWMNTRVQGIAEYDIETGKRIRNLAYADTAAGLEPLDDSLLATGTRGVPGGSDWGAYLLRYKGGDGSPIRSDITPDCRFVEVTFSKDGKYSSALCDGTVLNTVFDTYVTKKLEAIIFQTENLKVLTSTPLNRHYDPASVAIDSAPDGLIEAIVDEPSTIRTLLIPTQSVQAASRPPTTANVKRKMDVVMAGGQPVRVFFILTATYAWIIPPPVRQR